MTSNRKRRPDPDENSGRGAIHLLVPLEADSRDDLRFRRTAIPLARRLAQTEDSFAWGLYAASEQKPNLQFLPATVPSRKEAATGRMLVDAEAIGLIVLQLGPASGTERRREGLLLAADHVFRISDKVPHEADLFGPDSAQYSRDIVERAARRLRRRGEWQDGRWFVPSV